MRRVTPVVALAIHGLLCAGCGEGAVGPEGYWEGSGHAREVLMDDTFRHLWRSCEFEFWFVLDPSGDVAGEIELDYDAELTVENLPAVTLPAPGGNFSFAPEVGGQLTDLDPRRRFPLAGEMSSDGRLSLRIATEEDEREKLEFTLQAKVGVSAGLVGAGAVGGGGVGGADYGDRAIEIPMTPFTPFTSGAELTRRAGGVWGAHHEEGSDKHAIEWSARWVRPAGGEGGLPPGRARPPAPLPGEDEGPAGAGAPPGGEEEPEPGDGETGGGLELAVELDETLSPDFEAGLLVALRRIEDGRVESASAACDGLHLESARAPGITIDGEGPFPRPRGACAYGRIVPLQ